MWRNTCDLLSLELLNEIKQSGMREYTKKKKLMAFNPIFLTQFASGENILWEKTGEEKIPKKTGDKIRQINRKSPFLAPLFFRFFSINVLIHIAIRSSSSYIFLFIRGVTLWIGFVPCLIFKMASHIYLWRLLSRHKWELIRLMVVGMRFLLIPIEYWGYGSV